MTPRILVMDDDRSLLRSIELSLAFEGFTVETAADGLEGLDRISAADFDLVVLDLQMPRMDGRGFFHELRARGDATPVLILSAYDAEKTRNELGAEAAIAKPFDPDLLIEKVKDLVAYSAQDAQAARDELSDQGVASAQVAEKPRVLAIEDDPPTARIMRLILETEGFTLQVAGSRDEALIAIQDEAPDVVIMDYLMEGLSPSDFVRQLRDDGFVGPILLCTAFHEDVDLDVDGVLLKPFEPDELPKRLRELLSRDSYR